MWHAIAAAEPDPPPEIPTVVPARVGCLAHRWVRVLIRFPNSPFNRLFERSNTSRSCHRPGAKLGSHPAKSRQDPGGVWTVICAGKQHFANLLDSSRPARGLLHTEEVTGSIPVSPTQLSGQSRSCDWPFLIFRQQQSAAAGSRTPSRAIGRACRALREWRLTGPRCRSPLRIGGFAYVADSLRSGIETMPVDHRGAVWINEYLQVLACASERA